MSIKVSVIIPAYNAERFIRKTLDSVLEQTFRDFEVLVVDDGSTDETAKIVESFGEPVRCLRKANGGVSTARNYGVEKARGEYIAFLDADDSWQPTKLEAQVKMLDENPDIGLCFCSMQKVDENLNPLEKVEATDYEDYTEGLLLYLCIISGTVSSTMVRRDVSLKAGGFDPAFSTAADWDYFLRLSLMTKFKPIPECFMNYREVTGSMSSNIPLVERDIIAVLDKFFNQPNLPKKYKALKNQSYSNQLMILSGEYLHTKDLGKSLKCLLHGLERYPKNMTRPLGIPVRWTKRFLMK